MTHASNPADPPTPPAASSEGGAKRALRAFRHRDFRIFWSGAMASNIGTWCQNITVPYVLYEITGRAFIVGLATFLQVIPGLLLGPLAGSLADRVNRRILLIVTQSLMALTSAAMAVAWATGAHQTWLMLSLLATSGVIGGLNIPSWQAFVRDLIDDPADLLSAITLNSVQFNASRAFGPAIAGVLLATAGASWAFLANALSFGFVIVALLLVRPHAAHVPSTDVPRIGVVEGFKDALAYVRVQRGILMGLTLVLLVAFLGSPLQALAVVFSEDVFHKGSFGLAALNVVFGVGAVVAFFISSGWDHVVTRANMVRWSLPTYAVAILAFALSPNLWVALVPMLVVGGAFLAVISIANSTTQYIVADHIRGRVMALNIMCFSGAGPIGSLLQGWVVDRIGVRATVCAAGSLLLVATFVLIGRPSFVNRLDDPHDSEPAPTTAAPAGAAGQLATT